ncbi:MAG: hypothetical protein WDA16_03990 [Candidatus Thermoplasmatota archaeon]
MAWQQGLAYIVWLVALYFLYVDSKGERHARLVEDHIRQELARPPPPHRAFSSMFAPRAQPPAIAIFIFMASLLVALALLGYTSTLTFPEWRVVASYGAVMDRWHAIVDMRVFAAALMLPMVAVALAQRSKSERFQRFAHVAWIPLVAVVTPTLPIFLLAMVALWVLMFVVASIVYLSAPGILRLMDRANAKGWRPPVTIAYRFLSTTSTMLGFLGLS